MVFVFFLIVIGLSIRRYFAGGRKRARLTVNERYKEREASKVSLVIKWIVSFLVSRVNDKKQHKAASKRLT